MKTVLTILALVLVATVAYAVKPTKREMLLGIHSPIKLKKETIG